MNERKNYETFSMSWCDFHIFFLLSFSLLSVCKKKKVEEIPLSLSILTIQHNIDWKSPHTKLHNQKFFDFSLLFFSFSFIQIGSMKIGVLRSRRNSCGVFFFRSLFTHFMCKWLDLETPAIILNTVMLFLWFKKKKNKTMTNKTELIPPLSSCHLRLNRLLKFSFFLYLFILFCWSIYRQYFVDVEKLLKFNWIELMFIYIWRSYWI